MDVINASYYCVPKGARTVVFETRQHLLDFINEIGIDRIACVFKGKELDIGIKLIIEGDENDNG